MGGWTPLPAWATPYLNATYLLTAFENPLAYLAGQVGMPLLATSIFAVSVFAGWRHTKSLLGAGVVALLLTPVLYVVPELRYAAFLALALGAAAILYELIRKVV